jgi:hypothetical protein
MVQVVAGSRQETTDIPAEIQDLTTRPNWMIQQFVEVNKLGLPL